MHIVIAADKFKHSLNSFEVCDAITKGFMKASAEFTIRSLPLSDGGDGLAEIMAHYAALKKERITVRNPLFKEVESYFLINEKGDTCFIEMAKASGLNMLKPDEYNCALTSSYGTGQMLKKAIASGAKKIVLGIGGSATNDCGIGMATAIGYRFLDGSGNELQPIGKDLSQIQSIDFSGRMDVSKISIEIACDVDNYLTGEAGATRIYAPQKGATPAMVEELELGMQHFCEVVKKELGVDMTAIKGGGAAGGMGAGCVAFLNAQLVRGTDLMFHYSHAEEEIQKADIVITGEGKIDEQTLNGKLVHGVGQLCLKHGKPLIALCGSLNIGGEKLSKAGVTAAFSILNKPMALSEAFVQASDLLTETSYAVACILKEFGISHSPGLRAFDQQ